MLGYYSKSIVNETLFRPTPTEPYNHSSRFNSFTSRDALDLLQDCKTFKQIKVVHCKTIRSWLTDDQILSRKLLLLYFSFGRKDYAALLFNQILHPDSYTWNLMIRESTIHGSPDHSISLYNRMITDGFPPDKFTIPFVIKACLSSSSLNKGKETHGHAIKAGLYNDTFTRNTLMDLYFKFGDVRSGCAIFDSTRVRTIVSWTTLVSGLVSCGELDAALQAFDGMPERNVVSWTAIINGFVKNHRPQEAFELFRRMQVENVVPNEYTIVTLLKACAQLGSLKLGRWIHDCALKGGFRIGPFLGTALIDMYSKCGSLRNARRVFQVIERKNLVCWNAMITSLGVHGCGEEAIELFREMEGLGILPDAITFVGVLSACVSQNDVEEGQRLFNCMMEDYKIEPLKEHEDCMAQLCLCG